VVVLHYGGPEGHTRAHRKVRSIPFEPPSRGRAGGRRYQYILGGRLLRRGHHPLGGWVHRGHQSTDFQFGGQILNGLVGSPQPSTQLIERN